MEFDRLDAEKEMFTKQNLAAEETLRKHGLNNDNNNGNYNPDGATGNPVLGQGQGSIAVGELGMGSVATDGSIVMSANEMALASHNIQQRELISSGGTRHLTGPSPERVPTAPNRKWKQKYDAIKVKKERALVLTSEADELRAMETHLEEKINTMVS